MPVYEILKEDRVKQLSFGPVVFPRQGTSGRVVCFSATAQQICKIARIERIGRDKKGSLTGFQRPRIAGHIREIRDYLARPEAILPNAIVLAFSDGVKISRAGTLNVDVSSGPPGWLVDGQQRLSAALEVHNGFELLVSAFICEDLSELNRQFILVNNTRPLPKPLVYELLPSTTGLPHRLSDRAEAALLTEELNYRDNSSLRGQILQQTNPEGVVKDTLLQKLLMNSIQHGALRNGHSSRPSLNRRFELVSSFFEAVQEIFADDWQGHTAKTSRLLHGAGIISMGYVMDELNIRRGASKVRDFKTGLRPLVGRTHWTSGEWHFTDERRPWNALQNTSGDYRRLSHHLVRLVRRGSFR